ncbi:hypothetical protein K432DRAFT_349822 [Lepidopterella palustris CBS 459.81]|uniref:Uncharacterized protein n=1 Tax=Lepidopterella palustris CBS 459.81 TaxID=1314670 RepID=A0A8E2JGS2_9PEZI|nr:hypothetical protein K432DRAFT_349822 [Lepidopterella palustris CBS 459.81]
MSNNIPIKISPYPFYGEWKGHPISDLSTLYSIVASQRPDKPIIYFAGDSSLDNKYWVPSASPGRKPLPVPVPEIYDAILKPPQPKPDVAFWMNHYLGEYATALNTAVEASTLRDRDAGLLPHDEFIRDHIGANDVLVVSVGANDIALSPTVATALRMLQLAWLSPRSSLEKGTAWSLGHFKHMFGAKIQSYVEQLVAKRKPRAVVICMIYFPLEDEFSEQKSWADASLKVMGYNKNPGHLQAAIRSMYELATKTIRIEGTTIVPCALFEVLDGKSAGDYTARVEPSVEGGRKMAEHLKNSLDAVLGLE